MHRDHQDIGRALEPMLHPVWMVGVHIDIGDARQPLLSQRRDRKRRVIEIAKPVCAVRQTVMRATSRMKNNTARAQQFNRQKRATCTRGGAAIHFGKDGVCHSPKAMARAGCVIHILGFFGAHERLDIEGVMPCS